MKDQFFEEIDRQLVRKNRRYAIGIAVYSLALLAWWYFK